MFTTLYLWIKALHIISMVAWFAGLFYLPRLFVYHCDISSNDHKTYALFSLMEWRLFHIIMLPACISTLITGLALALWNRYYWIYSPSFWVKIISVVGVLAYFFCTYWHMQQFATQNNTYSSRYYRFFNEIPTLLLIIIVITIVVRPL